MHRFLKLTCLALLVSFQAQAHLLRLPISPEGEEMARHVRFNRGEIDQNSIHLPKGQRKVFQRYYQQCMDLTDGYYCDAPIGSCEHGTCGKNNKSCKPRMASSRERNVPKNGRDCSAYAYGRLRSK